MYKKKRSEGKTEEGKKNVYERGDMSVRDVERKRIVGESGEKRVT